MDISKKDGFIYIYSLITFMTICLLITLSMVYIKNTSSFIKKINDNFILREQARAGPYIGYLNLCYIYDDAVKNCQSKEEFIEYFSSYSHYRIWEENFKKQKYVKDSSIKIFIPRDDKGPVKIEKDIIYLIFVSEKKSELGKMSMVARVKITNPYIEIDKNLKEKLKEEVRRESLATNINNNLEANNENKEDTREMTEEEINKKVEETIKDLVMDLRKEYNNPKKIKESIKIYSLIEER